MNLKKLWPLKIKKQFPIKMALFLIAVQSIYTLLLQCGLSLDWANTFLKYHPVLGSSSGTILHMFFHASWLHLFGNIIMLVSLDLYVKPKGKYLLCFLICGQAGSVAVGVYHFYFEPVYLYALGASSAIFGLIAFTLLKYGHIQYAMLFTATLVLICTLQFNPSTFSHLIGFFTGALMGYVYKIKSIS